MTLEAWQWKTEEIRKDTLPVLLYDRGPVNTDMTVEIHIRQPTVETRRRKDA